MPPPEPVHHLRAAAAAGALAALLTAAAAFAGSSPPSGSVRQVSGKNGCYTADGSSASGPGTCHNIRGGTGSTTIAISPDGRFAYLVGYGSPPTVPPVLSVFKRNLKNGTLRQLRGKAGCFSIDGSSEEGPNTCTNARDLDTGDATSIVISRDGRYLYVASQYRQGLVRIGGIAIFRRSLRTGKLRQLSGKAGCVTAIAYAHCAIAREVDEVSNLHITPDQKFLYASDYEDPPNSGIAVFRRDAKTGDLRQLKGANGCITDDGTTAQSTPKVVCRAMPNLDQPWDVATPDNRFAYIPSWALTFSSGPKLVQGFERNAKGGLVPLKGQGGCVSDDGTSPAGPCINGRGLSNPLRAVPSKNGRFLYITSYDPSSIAVLNRNPKTGLLSERAGNAACISADGTTGDGETCRNGRALAGGSAGILSPDGRTLYFAQYYSSALVIFRVSPKTGAFKQLRGKFGCVTPDGSSEQGAGTCGKGRAIEGAYQVALGSGGRDVYVAAYGANGAALFYATP
jgi:hypothetical protein